MIAIEFKERERKKIFLKQKQTSVMNKIKNNGKKQKGDETSYPHVIIFCFVVSKHCIDYVSCKI